MQSCKNLSKNLLTNQSIIQATCKQLNSKKCLIGKTESSRYVAKYPTTLVFSDGSTLMFRYHEPRQIVKLPLTLDELEDSERKKWLIRRRIKEVQVKEKDKTDVQYDKNRYLNILRKR